MKILEYLYRDKNWEFNKSEFQKINLIVGDSGSGKTRLFNTIVNLGICVAQNKVQFEGEWETLLEINNDKYKWTASVIKNGRDLTVNKEILYKNDTLVLNREKGEVSFNNKTLIKLPQNEFSISTLREEEIINPLHDGFSKIIRRCFFSDDQEKNAALVSLNKRMIQEIGNKKDLNELFKMNLPLNPKLFILSEYFPNIYEKIVDLYKETFENITEIRLVDNLEYEDVLIPGFSIIFCIKERNVKNYIRLDELSSGMKKVLLILTDIFSMPQNSIYMIDEYENSLGMSPLSALSDIIMNEEYDTQIFMTSHHPYIINKIPVGNWYVTHRKGTHVYIDYGQELIDRYSVSSQEKYIQLLNDPHYGEGIE